MTRLNYNIQNRKAVFVILSQRNNKCLRQWIRYPDLIIIQCINVSKHHVVPYKYVQLFCVNKKCVHSRKVKNRCEKEGLRQAKVLAYIFKEIKGKGILMKLQMWTLRKTERVCQDSGECVD